MPRVITVRCGCEARSARGRTCHAGRIQGRTCIARRTGDMPEVSVPVVQGTVVSAMQNAPTDEVARESELAHPEVSEVAWTAHTDHEAESELSDLYAANWNQLSAGTVDETSSEDEGYVYAATVPDDDIELIPCESYLIGDDDDDEKVMQFGAYRGMRYKNILERFPKYHEELKQAYKGKSTPKYVVAYLEWYHKTTRTKPLPQRTKVYPKAVKKAAPCADGCINITPTVATSIFANICAWIAVSVTRRKSN